MKHRISKLAFKLTIGFVILGILICGISSFIGYNQYKNSIEKQYNATAYDIAETAFSYFKNGELTQYAELAEGYKNGTVSEEEIKAALESDRYKEISSAFDSLREAMGANDVLAFVLDKEELQSYDGDRENWNPMLYMFDSYTVPEYSYELGDSGSFNPDYINELADIKDTGCISSSYFVSKGDYGYNTAGILPVTNHDGVFAMISVEIPMTTLKSSLQQYILNAILVTVAVIIVVIAVYMIYLFRRVIKPINTIAAEAGSFTSNDNRISEALSGIKTRDEIESLAGSILKMETDINEYIENLTKVTAEKERIGAELDVARHIQSSMLPCIFPAFPERDEFEVYATMTPAKEVGGDFYDFFMVDERHLAIVMADVSGKGVPAALFMVIGKTLIKDHTQPGRDLGEVFSEVNDLLCESNSEGLFITAFEGVLDLVTGEFNFVNAGHEMPYIYKGSSFEAYKIKPGFVLAGMEGMRYKAGSMTLEPGDKLFQYTDGVTEATDSANQLYGMERLSDVLNKVKDDTPEAVLDAVKTDIDEFVGDAPQFDDITMLCLEYTKKMEDR